MAILCTLRHINLSFGQKVLFNDAELSIDESERIGLLGLNGKGKSSLFKILAGALTPDISKPAFSFDKQRDGFSVFLVPQDLEVEENDKRTVRDIFFDFHPQLKKMFQNNDLEGIELAGGWDLINNFESYLKSLGGGELEASVANMSGGEQKKILLALGLSAPASLILWDEPTNHLDIETIKRFEDELNNCKNAFLLITHDRYLLGKVTKRIFHIKNGKIEKFEGSYPEYLEFLDKEEADRLKLLERLQNSMRRETEWMRQGIKARGTRSKKRVENFHNLARKIGEVKGEQRRRLQMDLTASQRKTKALVKLEEVSLAFGERTLFENINLKLWKGDKIGLIGANGAGKTSLCRLIQGSLGPSRGDIWRADDLKIQFFSQKREELDLSQTPHHLIGEGNDFVVLPNGHKLHVVSYFERYLFERGEIHRPLSTFSGGERNRLQMALNLKRAGDVWIFDEPTNDLDLETLKILEDQLLNFEGTLILISHDRAFLSAVTNKTWLLDDQKIETFEGGYSQVEGYLDAVALEKEILQTKDGPQAVEVEVESKPEKIKLGQAEKKRLEELPSLIEEKEALIAQIDGLMIKMGGTGLQDKETTQKLIMLSEKKDLEEEALLALYEELETLQ